MQCSSSRRAGGGVRPLGGAVLCARALHAHAEAARAPLVGAHQTQQAATAGAQDARAGRLRTRRTAARGTPRLHPLVLILTLTLITLICHSLLLLLLLALTLILTLILVLLFSALVNSLHFITKPHCFIELTHLRTADTFVLALMIYTLHSFIHSFIVLI